MNEESLAYPALSKLWEEMSLSYGRRRKPWLEPAAPAFRGWWKRPTRTITEAEEPGEAREEFQGRDRGR